MSRSVVVVDYGIGNVFSVCNALKRIGASPELTRDIIKIKRADRVILPGVGAFGRAISALKDYGLDAALSEYVESGRPFLGICLGMQVLMDISYEFGEHAGLGFISGSVKKIPVETVEGNPLRVPHISWARVEKSKSASDDAWTTSALNNGTLQSDAFYFVHSFMAVPVDSKHVLAQTSYGGNLVTAAIRRDNITGVQFHPERSGTAGLSLLERFVAGR